ncbi:putative ATP-dependent RNA helicase DDX23 [Reticulomyxa filosa]|uniref:Putative ATP-dependent RNA helicase DDX23 n=1 Tax=Reticulomyxa filosa TaxID=46433 RepID=X6NLZ3_RETFI|nr:putative ATP-dependent RNA helicase DDX23 [Reticulomyxa filosa]|eukprot:ETO27305.1 putative ATP-dependent RNA helicase DDX23 [Reticulomyxa filosa]
MQENGTNGKEKEKKKKSHSRSRSRSRSRSNSKSKSRSRSREEKRRRHKSGKDRDRDKDRDRKNRSRSRNDHYYRSRYYDHRSVSRSRTRSESKHKSKSPQETNDPNKKAQDKEKKKPDRIWNGFAWILVEPNKNEGQMSDPNALNENEIARKRCETVLAANHRALGQALAVAQLASNLNPLSLIHGNALVTNALLGRGMNATSTHPSGLGGLGMTGITNNMGGLGLNQPTPAQGLSASDNNTAFAMAYSAANSAIQQQLNKWIPGDNNTENIARESK